ncbi:MAG: hypothetical protein ACOCTT_00830 [archaeon]
MIKIETLKNTLGTLFFMPDPLSRMSEFLFYAKIIIALILILYTRKVLKLGSKATLITAALVLLVFFTDFWIFGTIEAIAVTIIAFLIIGILGFLD